jgi:hypothetical protein
MQDDTDATAPTFDWKSITLAGLAAIVAVGLVGTALFPAYMPIRHYRIPDGHDSMQPTAPGGTHLVVTQWGIDTSAIARGDRVMFRYDETTDPASLCQALCILLAM